MGFVFQQRLFLSGKSNYVRLCLCSFSPRPWLYQKCLCWVGAKVRYQCHPPTPRDCQTIWEKENLDLSQTVHWNPLTHTNLNGDVHGFNSHFWVICCWFRCTRQSDHLKGIPWTEWPRSNSVFSDTHIKAASDYTTQIWDQTRANSYISTIWYDYCSIWLHLQWKFINCLKKAWLQWFKHCLCSGLVIFTYKDKTCRVSVPRRNIISADRHHLRHRGKTTQTPCH